MQDKEAASLREAPETENCRHHLQRPSGDTLMVMGSCVKAAGLREAPRDCMASADTTYRGHVELP